MHVSIPKYLQVYTGYYITFIPLPSNTNKYYQNNLHPLNIECQYTILIMQYKPLTYFKHVNPSNQCNIHTPSDANGAPMAISLLTRLASPTLAASSSFLPNSVSVFTWEVSRCKPDTIGEGEGLLLASPPLPTK